MPSSSTGLHSSKPRSSGLPGRLSGFAIMQPSQSLGIASYFSRLPNQTFMRSSSPSATNCRTPPGLLIIRRLFSFDSSGLCIHCVLHECAELIKHCFVECLGSERHNIFKVIRVKVAVTVEIVRSQPVRFLSLSGILIERLIKAESRAAEILAV